MPFHLFSRVSLLESVRAPAYMYAYVSVSVCVSAVCVSVHVWIYKTQA